MWKTRVALKENGQPVDFMVGQSKIRIFRSSVGIVNVLIEAPRDQPIVRQDTPFEHNHSRAVE